jgi:hypothetical protein
LYALIKLTLEYCQLNDFYSMKLDSNMFDK